MHETMSLSNTPARIVTHYRSIRTYPFSMHLLQSVEALSQRCYDDVWALPAVIQLASSSLLPGEVSFQDFSSNSVAATSTMSPVVILLLLSLCFSNVCFDLCLSSSSLCTPFFLIRLITGCKVLDFLVCIKFLVGIEVHW